MSRRGMLRDNVCVGVVMCMCTVRRRNTSTSNQLMIGNYHEKDISILLETLKDTTRPPQTRSVSSTEILRGMPTALSDGVANPQILELAFQKHISKTRENGKAKRHGQKDARVPTGI